MKLNLILSATLLSVGMASGSFAVMHGNHENGGRDRAVAREPVARAPIEREREVIEERGRGRPEWAGDGPPPWVEDRRGVPDRPDRGDVLTAPNPRGELEARTSP